MSVQFKNNSFTILAADIDNAVVSITVATGTGALLPALTAGQYFYATLSDIEGDMEIIKVTAVVGDVLTVERAQEGTTAKAFPAGSLIENRFTAKTLRDIADLDYLLL